MATTGDAEKLRRQMTDYYRAKFPWIKEPTLGTFRESLKDKSIVPLVDKLIAQQGAQRQLQDLRLLDFIDL